MAASALPGTVNYALTIIIVSISGFEEVGQFRLLLSSVSLLGLASMIETRKVFISELVSDNRRALNSLATARIYYLAAVFLGVLALYLVGLLFARAPIPNALVGVAALAIPIYMFDLYLPVLQAERKFGPLFRLELSKYGAAFTVFLICYWMHQNIALSTLAMLATIAVCHSLFFCRTARPHFDKSPHDGSWKRHLKTPASRRARTFSYANMLPGSLEHVDKILVGWIFGLEFLGIYALAYSTGRFFYNIVKPALYIYYRQFVDVMPVRKLLLQTGSIFTVIGGLCAISFLYAVATVPAMEKFGLGSAVTVILFLSYGIGMVRTVYCQAFVLNKHSDAGSLLRASMIATSVSLVILAAALCSQPSIALILLALQYPFRDGITTALLARARLA